MAAPSSPKRPARWAMCLPLCLPPPLDVLSILEYSNSQKPQRILGWLFRLLQKLIPTIDMTVSLPLLQPDIQRWRHQRHEEHLLLRAVAYKNKKTNLVKYMCPPSSASLKTLKSPPNAFMISSKSRLLRPHIFACGLLRLFIFKVSHSKLMARAKVAIKQEHDTLLRPSVSICSIRILRSKILLSKIIHKIVIMKSYDPAGGVRTLQSPLQVECD